MNPQLYKKKQGKNLGYTKFEKIQNDAKIAKFADFLNIFSKNRATKNEANFFQEAETKKQGKKI